MKAIDSKYLLTGFAQCAICGGSLMARSRDYGSTRKFGYLCGYHHQRGRTVCVNGLEAPMEATDHAVLASIERDLLRPEIVERAIEFAIDELRPDSDDSRRADILAEIHRLDSELARLTAAIASGGDLPALLAAVKERQDRRERRERWERMLIELDAMSRIGRSELSCLEREIRHRLADWRAMLRREVPEARELLRNLIVGRIAFTPRPETRVYEFSGRGSFGRVLAGTTSPVSVVTPAGFEPAFPARRTLSLGWRSLTTLRSGSCSPGRDPGPDLNCGSDRWRSSSCSTIKLDSRQYSNPCLSRDHVFAKSLM